MHSFDIFNRLTNKINYLKYFFSTEGAQGGPCWGGPFGPQPGSPTGQSAPAACQGNMKESWKAINELLNKRSKSSNIDCLKESGSETVHKKDISNAMNSFFCSVGKDLADKIDPAPNPLFAGDYEINKPKATFHFRTIEVHEIRDAFATVKTAKSFGTDNISSYLLKLTLLFIENSLAFLFNTSIETICFPDSWKVARVTPIFKDGDKTDKSNYRPISVLPVISRLFEKLVTNQLYQYMNDNGHFSSGQSGFLRLHSTVTCLLKNTDDWYNGMDLGKLVGLVFIDLKKAFDTVDHNILCKKLELYGVQQRKLSWFESYLTNRKQFCRVNGVNSEIGDIEVGVPQGSCLGPLVSSSTSMISHKQSDIPKCPCMLMIPVCATSLRT